MYYTYAHYTADTKELFYIGKGTFAKRGDFKRAYVSTHRNTHWNNKVNKHNGFDVKILSIWKTEKEAFDHERLLISCFEGRLVNLTTGGEGCSGRKHSVVEKHKRASSLRGLKRTPHALERMSAAQKKNKVALDSLNKAREKQKKQILCVSTGVIYPSLIAASKATDIVFQNISKCCLGKRPNAGGLEWKYLND
jgi:hypothetical protein